jgi:hypothetical protein
VTKQAEFKLGLLRDRIMLGVRVEGGCGNGGLLWVGGCRDE